MSLSASILPSILIPYTEYLLGTHLVRLQIHCVWCTMMEFVAIFNAYMLSVLKQCSHGLALRHPHLWTIMILFDVYIRMKWTWRTWWSFMTKHCEKQVLKKTHANLKCQTAQQNAFLICPWLHSLLSVCNLVSTNCNKSTYVLMPRWCLVLSFLTLYSAIFGH